MSNKQWKLAWKHDQIEFHQEQVNPLLQSYWPMLALPPQSTVFVPLCGKSLDMAWLLAQNHRIVGVEVSSIAVAAFFAANGLVPKQRHVGKLICWSCRHVEIYCGDFFDLTASMLQAVAAVYDRAALLAFSPQQRKRYVAYLQTILPQQVPILLLSTEYPDSAISGQPFTVDAEIVALYAPAFHVELLHAEYGHETHPGYGHTELEVIEEKVYLLRAQ